MSNQTTFLRSQSRILNQNFKYSENSNNSQKIKDNINNNLNNRKINKLISKRMNEFKTQRINKNKNSNLNNKPFKQNNQKISCIKSDRLSNNKRSNSINSNISLNENQENQKQSKIDSQTFKKSFSEIKSPKFSNNLKSNSDDKGEKNNKSKDNLFMEQKNYKCNENIEKDEILEKQLNKKNEILNSKDIMRLKNKLADKKLKQSKSNSENKLNLLSYNPNINSNLFENDFNNKTNKLKKSNSQRDFSDILQKIHIFKNYLQNKKNYNQKESNIINDSFEENTQIKNPYMLKFFLSNIPIPSKQINIIPKFHYNKFQRNNSFKNLNSNYSKFFHKNSCILPSNPYESVLEARELSFINI